MSNLTSMFGGMLDDIGYVNSLGYEVVITRYLGNLWKAEARKPGQDPMWQTNGALSEAVRILARDIKHE